MSFDIVKKQLRTKNVLSQSLWNRAMSFDYQSYCLMLVSHVSIPLEQGNVFRRLNDEEVIKTESQSLWNRAMSFDLEALDKLLGISKSQSLWNRAMSFDESGIQGIVGLGVSIPLEQGNVFRHHLKAELDTYDMSQSLWNRAMSFDRISRCN